MSSIERWLSDKALTLTVASVLGVVTAIASTTFVFLKSTELQKDKVQAITERLASENQSLKIRIDVLDNRLTALQNQIDKREMSFEQVQKSIETQISLLKQITKDISNIESKPRKQ